MSKRLNRPSFSTPLWASVRQGEKEFGQVFQALPSSIRLVEEQGTLGNPTPQMVTEESGALRDKKSILDRYDSRTFDRSDRDREIER
jgi:hypothetical protein